MKSSLIIVFSLLAITTIAQCPNPNPTSQGAYPQVMNDAYVGSSYSNNTTLVFKRDTIFLGFSVEVDSIIILDVLNLPNGLSFNCANPECSVSVPTTFVAPRECLEIQGTPTMENSNDSLIVVYEMWMTLFSSPISLTDSIVVRLDVINNVGITEDTDNAFQVFPNPTEGSFTLNSVWSESIKAVQAINAQGRLIDIEFRNNEFYINEPAGVYYLLITHNNDKVARLKVVKI